MLLEPQSKKEVLQMSQEQVFLEYQREWKWKYGGDVHDQEADFSCSRMYLLPILSGCRRYNEIL